MEQEADQIADQILAAPAHSVIGGAAPRVQRSAGSTHGQTDSAPDSVDRALGSSGRPLDTSLRQDMEQRFNHDFSRVRVHSDAVAYQSAHEVNASAYTVGNDIVFGAGRYSTGTQDGRRLLAHELTHVVQQSGGHSDASPAEMKVQRKPSGDDVKTAVPASPVAAPVATSPAAAPKVAGNTASVTFLANYHEVPGQGKDRITPRGTRDALWIELGVHPFVPKGKDTQLSKGVVSGAGPQQIDTFAIPVTEGASPVGTGSVSPGLRYSSSLKTRTFLETKMLVFGDVDELEKRTADHLAEKGYPGATVEIKTVEAKTSEIGQSTFYYRVHNDSEILMEIEAQPEGEKRSDYSKTAGDNRNLEAESERHGEHKVETVEEDYSKLVVKTLNDVVKRVDDSREVLIKNLSELILNDHNYNKTEKEQDSRVDLTIDDYTKNVKGHTESGEKDKSNWADKIKKGIGAVKKVIKIPFIDKVPVVGWFSRRIKGWWLDLGELAADQFAESGKVKYTDSAEDTDANRKTKTTGEGKMSDEIEIKSTSKEDRKAELVETFKKHEESDWQRWKEEVEKTKASYSKVATTDSGGGSDRVKAARSTSTSVTVSGSTTWKFSKPVVNASVVSGDSEVSDKPLTP